MLESYEGDIDKADFYLIGQLFWKHRSVFLAVESVEAWLLLLQRQPQLK
jgi:hypothetical protein